MDHLHFKSAVEIARLIREREVRAIEALEHFLARVEKLCAGAAAGDASDRIS
jgi:Asp-tRNA(Asn)/Glu-tRNA(Gln) amidotransferase A subunit family amidase